MALKATPLLTAYTNTTGTATTSTETVPANKVWVLDITFQLATTGSGSSAATLTINSVDALGMAVYATTGTYGQTFKIMLAAGSTVQGRVQSVGNNYSNISISGTEHDALP